jgi:hypothetical protein
MNLQREDLQRPPSCAQGKAGTAFIIRLLFGLCVSALSAFAQGVKSPLKWQSLVTSNLLEATLTEPIPVRTDKALPLVIYLKNIAAPRLGTESDQTILQDLRRSGFLVMILDYAHHPNSRVPFINRDLGKLRDDLRAKKLLPDRPIDDAHIFIVPEGSRLKRDVVFYQDPGRTLAMDIIYPSKPGRPVGAILEFSCDNQNRFGNTSLSICSDTLLDAEATQGFAVAMADHPVPPPYRGLDPMPDCALKIKAAVRTLRAVGSELGLNGKIVPVGFSRGSGMALMLTTTEGRVEFESPGENTPSSSAVQGAIVMSGRFTYLDLLAEDPMLPRYAKAWGDKEAHFDTWRNHGALDYLTQATVPLFLTINCTESRDALHQMTVLRKRLADLGNDEYFLMDREPRGHKVTLDPTILSAMDAYLRSRLN